MEAQENYMEAWIEAENKIYEQQQQVLGQIKKMVTEPFFKEIEEYLEECDITSQYKLTTEEPPKRHKQNEEDYELIKEAWVNQYVNGGIEGDSFAGQIWIKVSDKEFFTFHYNM
ncbi:hypothetical protein [Tenacibaculum sp. 190524A02b]|uniref:hypothetical protein n=1 Tax=Tenacibaculum vairaonense TaxID=3137860 RepID=UPI0031FB1CC8